MAKKDDKGKWKAGKRRRMTKELKRADAKRRKMWGRGIEQDALRRHIEGLRQEIAAL